MDTGNAQSIVVIAATNRIDMIDRAFLAETVLDINRSGRSRFPHRFNPKTDFSQDNFSKLRPKSFAYWYDLIISSLLGDRAISL
jgi:hypothetical protein